MGPLSLQQLRLVEGCVHFVGPMLQQFRFVERVEPCVHFVVLVLAEDGAEML